MENKSEIISISLKKDTLEKINYLTEKLKLSGRSETIRNAISLLDSENKSLEKLKGKVSGILIIIHKHSKNTLKLSHIYQRNIKTHMHSHLENDQCIDIFIVEGKSDEIKEMKNTFQKDKRTIVSKLITT